jgi:hypothetical protein
MDRLGAEADGAGAHPVPRADRGTRVFEQDAIDPDSFHDAAVVGGAALLPRPEPR